MRKYKCLKNNFFQIDDFSITSIRDEDKFIIKDIRNEQLYHLRQNNPLSTEDQEKYFKNIINKLFEEEKPNQLLFSFFYKNVFIGYGGLVHINWIDKNAEISFIMKTDCEKLYFQENWSVFLKLIQNVAFIELEFHKIYTYAFDLRPHLYKVLEENDFLKEAVLKEHCFYDNKFIDVIIHTKINGNNI